jgi:hypothetical protein
MKPKNLKIWAFIISLILILIILAVSFVFLKTDVAKQILPAKEATATTTPTIINNPLKTPEKVKGIYITGNAFALAKKRDQLFNLVKRTELNTVVIDIKDNRGKLLFQPTSEELKDWPLSSVKLNYDDFKNILSDLQDNNIYTIARITTFQDSVAAEVYKEAALKNTSGNLWRDYRGIAWLDMTNPQSWKLVTELTKEAEVIGFDEVQFDYIRFPSDGNIKTIKYYDLPSGQRKYQALDNFFNYLKQNTAELTIPLSIDLFGLTYWQRQDQNYDLGIGQRLIDAGKYFNYISPMVYPSHYYSGVMGFDNPAAHPYEIVNKAMKDGNIMLASSSSTALSRPWLQDFNMGAIYNATMIKKEIQACDDNNCSGWLLWNAANNYTESALKKE